MHLGACQHERLCTQVFLIMLRACLNIWMPENELSYHQSRL